MIVDVSPLLRHLLEEIAGADPLPPAERGRRLAIEDLVLIEIERLRQLHFHIRLPADPRLRSFCEAALASPKASRTFEELAEDVGASARTLRRLFQDQLGMNFATWRQQALLVEALARLEEGVPISAVARELGYATPAAFTTMFKRVLGESPRNHRKYG